MSQKSNIKTVWCNKRHLLVCGIVMLFLCGSYLLAYFERKNMTKETQYFFEQNSYRNIVVQNDIIDSHFTPQCSRMRSLNLFATMDTNVSGTVQYLISNL
jgi:hypothetical protein